MFTASTPTFSNQIPLMISPKTGIVIELSVWVTDLINFGA